MTAALIVAGVAVIALCAQAAIIWFLVEELGNARVDVQEERRELITRIQRPTYTPASRQKAHTPDQEKQRRIDVAMRQVGTYTPRQNGPE